MGTLPFQSCPVMVIAIYLVLSCLVLTTQAARTTSTGPKCSYGDKQIRDACDSKTMSGCKTVFNPMDFCERTSTCTRKGASWQELSLCKSICWACLQALIYVPNMMQVPTSIRLDLNISTYGDSAGKVDKKSLQAGTMTESYQFVKDYFDQSSISLKTFSIKARIHNCHASLDQE